MLLRLATSSSAPFSISSETWMPRRSARCSWISSTTRRSRTCWRSTLRGGSSVFCWRRRSDDLVGLLLELADEHDAVVDDGGDAVEQHAAAGELAGLGERRAAGERERHGRLRQENTCAKESSGVSEMNSGCGFGRSRRSIPESTVPGKLVADSDTRQTV